MSDQTAKWVRRFIIFFIILLSLLLLAWLFPYYDHIIIIIGRILLPFVLALVLSLLLHPLVNLLEETGISRPLAILLIFLVFFSLVSLGIYKGYPRLLTQVRLLSEQVPALTESYQGWTKQLYAQTERFPDGIHKKLDGSFSDFEEWISTKLMNLLTSLTGIFDMVFLVAVIPVMTFYFLKDYQMIGRSLMTLLPVSWHDEAVRLSRELSHSLGGYIRGQLLISLFVGALASLGFWLVDLPYALILGIIAGITNIIPYFGPLLGAVPVLIVAATISVNMLIFSLLVVLVIQVLEGNLLSPYIMGRSIHIHPLVIIFALLAGGELAGIPGLILAVPVLTCLKVIVSEVHKGRIHIDR
ncbi:Predicted PurR-regulated permease PerM [Halobacillus alkaliphilus]|uniref:Predicted PurR-regulated permease PerM n=1 Tax=Halobacillus alkaliphilus TaxID=396056 RepID=A0A1I2JG14_9BACI|nr:AI-2E family transporter [Halobacillus alkaliphilus]SFF52930.1 Predicted PurR-regulated permease PerM [Halobacillus alkaliphilus]